MPPTMGRTRGRPKKQTRLNFQAVAPNEQSAPAANESDSDDDEDNAEFTSTPRRSVRSASGTANAAMPTRKNAGRKQRLPQAEQTPPTVAEREHEEGSNSVDENCVPLNKKFAVVVDSPNSTSKGKARPLSKTSKKAATPPTTSSATKNFTKAKEDSIVISESEHEEELFVKDSTPKSDIKPKEELEEKKPDPRPATTKKKSKKHSKQNETVIEDKKTVEDVEEVQPAKASKTKAPFQDDDDSGGEELFLQQSQPKAIKKNKQDRRSSRKSQQKDEVLPKASQPKSKRGFPTDNSDSEQEAIKTSQAKAAKKSKVKGVSSLSVAIDYDDDVITNATQTKKKGKAPVVQLHSRDSEEKEEQLQLALQQSQTKQKAPSKGKHIFGDSEDDVQELEAQPPQKKHKSGTDVAVKRSFLTAEDDEDLGPQPTTVVKKHISSEPIAKKKGALYIQRTISLPVDEPAVSKSIERSQNGGIPSFLKPVEMVLREPPVAREINGRAVFSDDGSEPDNAPRRGATAANFIRASQLAPGRKVNRVHKSIQPVPILSDESDIEGPTSSRRQPATQKTNRNKQKEVAVEKSEEGHTGNSRKRQHESSPSASEGGSRSRKKKKKAKKAKAADYEGETIDVEMANDDDSPQPTRKAGQAPKKNVVPEGNTDGETFDILLQSDDSPPRKKKENRSSAAQQPAPIAPMAPMMMTVDDSDSDDLPPQPSQARRRSPVKRIMSDMTAKESPAEKRLKRGERGNSRTDSSISVDSLWGEPKPKKEREIQEVEDDAPPPTQGRRLMQGRRRQVPARGQRRHRTEAEKSREVIQRRRNGERGLTIEDLTDSCSSSEEEQRGEFDTDDALSHFSDEEDDDEIDHVEEVRRSTLPQNRDKDDDDFIVPDDDGPLGAPTHSIPLEFTHAAHRPLKEHFREQIEWHVMKIVYPRFNLNDEVYLNAYNRLDKEPKSLVQSKFVSPVWNARFVRALNARPNFKGWQFKPLEGQEKKCDACGRGGKGSASWVVELSGPPYASWSLEPVGEVDSDSEADKAGSGVDSDSDVSGQTIDHNGNYLAKSTKEWHLGSHCYYNASNAHPLIHWKHQLHALVLEKMKEHGFLSPADLEERLSWSEKKKEQFGHDIVAELADKRVLKVMWRHWEEKIVTARNETRDRWGRVN